MTSRATSPILREMFAIMSERKIRQKTLSIREEIISRYKQGHATPRITTVEEMGAAIGLRLQWVEIEEKNHDQMATD